MADIGQAEAVKLTLETILSEQNTDGGFCESKLLRTHSGLPRPLLYLVMF